MPRGRDLENCAGRIVGPTASCGPVEVSIAALDEPSMGRLPVGAGPLTIDLRAEAVDRRQPTCGSDLEDRAAGRAVGTDYSSAVCRSVEVSIPGLDQTRHGETTVRAVR